MELSKKDQQYDLQWDIVDEFYSTNDPEGFGETINSDEANALRVYYFVDPNKQDVYQYRDKLATTNPQLAERAVAAARKIAELSGCTREEVDEMFSPLL